MRAGEIKFRGKRLDNGEWIYGSLVSIDDFAVIVEDCDFGWDPDTDINAFWFDKEEKEVDPETVGQFTGLRDRNGKEIYEHDLYEVNGVLCEVVYNSDMATFSYLEVIGQELGTTPIGLMLEIFTTVYKGNIYDNKDLLDFNEN